LSLDLRNGLAEYATVPGMNTFGYDGELTGNIDYQGLRETAWYSDGYPENEIKRSIALGS